ncbi:MAG TPA: DUF2970 domain-containing protein [Solimonas sp.]
MKTEKPEADNAPKRVTLWQTMTSVAASMFGVQSSKNRRRDFTHGNPLHFIVVGLLMVGLFITVLVVIVRLVLHNAGL